MSNEEIKCRTCGIRIKFEDSFKSTSGKFIPIDYATNKPHTCTKREQLIDERWKERDQKYDANIESYKEWQIGTTYQLDRIIGLLQELVDKK
jgi:hypothetical protein